MKKSALLLLAHMITPLNSPLEHSNNRKVLKGHSNRSEEDKAKLKGLKKFIIEGHEIYAINEKNAIKKYNKKIK